MDKIKQGKYIFFTGAPGSKWSSVANILVNIPSLKIDKSDYSETRCFKHSEASQSVCHLGNYFGTGMEYGENFENLQEFKKEELIIELGKPYSEDFWEGTRLIKSHLFSLNLNYLKKFFPEAVICLVLRPDYLCEEGWFGAGGFDISYPAYSTYYKNRQNMILQIKKENMFTRKFIYENSIEMHTFSRSWLENFFSFKIERDSSLVRYINMIEGVKPGSAEPLEKLKFDVSIGFYNLKSIFSKKS